MIKISQAHSLVGGDVQPPAYSLLLSTLRANLGLWTMPLSRLTHAGGFSIAEVLLNISVKKNYPVLGKKAQG